MTDTPFDELAGCASWQTVWRQGFAPLLRLAELVALHDGLAADDAHVIQGATTLGDDDAAVRTVTAACPLAYAAWVGSALVGAQQVEDRFAALCAGADAALCQPAACRFFINWADETPRDEMRAALLIEVEAEIARREGGAD